MNYLKRCLAILLFIGLTMSNTQALNITPPKNITLKTIAAFATFAIGGGCSLYHASKHVDPDDDQHWVGFLGYYASTFASICILSSDKLFKK